MLNKPKKNNCPEYLAWLREETGLEPHHLPNPEHGKRRNRDDLVVPMNRSAHEFLHLHPEEEKKMLKELYKLAKYYWDKYSGG